MYYFLLSSTGLFRRNLPGSRCPIFIVAFSTLSGGPFLRNYWFLKDFVVIVAQSTCFFSPRHRVHFADFFAFIFLSPLNEFPSFVSFQACSLGFIHIYSTSFFLSDKENLAIRSLFDEDAPKSLVSDFITHRRNVTSSVILFMIDKILILSMRTHLTHTFKWILQLSLALIQIFKFPRRHTLLLAVVAASAHKPMLLILSVANSHATSLHQRHWPRPWKFLFCDSVTWHGPCGTKVRRAGRTFCCEWLRNSNYK